jgi:hypothetical protein
VLCNMSSSDLEVGLGRGVQCVRDVDDRDRSLTGFCDGVPCLDGLAVRGPGGDYSEIEPEAPVEFYRKELEKLHAGTKPNSVTRRSHKHVRRIS